MSKTGRQNYRRGTRGTPKSDRQIVVRGVRRDTPDLRKLSRAVIAMALQEAEAAAEITDALTSDTPQTPNRVADTPDRETGSANV